jgi:hypothetical protein
MTIRTVAQQPHPAAQRSRPDVAQPIRLPHTLVWVCVALGCSSSPTAGLTPQPDAKPAPGCSAPLTCDSGAVHSCDNGVVGSMVDDCPSRGQVCSQGRCTSLACQMVEGTSTRTLSGCLFYTLQADNVTADEAAETSYLVNNATNDPARVQLEHATLGAAPGGTPGSSSSTAWVAIDSIQVPPGTSARLQASQLEVVNAGLNGLGAVRLESDRPITVAEVESDDGSQPATSSSATVVLPVQSLGNSYRAVTYPQAATPDVQQVVGSRGGAARVIIVGTQSGTRVQFTPVSDVSGDPGFLVPPLVAGEPLDITLNDGDVYQIYTNAPDEDLTGSLVSVISGAPVAVFSGNISTSYGSPITGINSADMAHEQMLPLSSWSKTWVAAPLAPQDSIGCTSFFADSSGAGGGSIWRVVASEDDTDVQLVSPTPGSTPETIRLSAGESITRISGQPFTIVGSKPILVTQGMDCEPTLSLAIGADPTALLTSLAFATVPSFDQVLAVVRSTGSNIALDGMLISEKFQPVGPGLELVELPLPTCNAPSGACIHRLAAPSAQGGGLGAFGMTLRGMDVSASFALTAPGLLRCDPPNSIICLN